MLYTVGTLQLSGETKILRQRHVALTNHFFFFFNLNIQLNNLNRSISLMSSIILGTLPEVRCSRTFNRLYLCTNHLILFLSLHFDIRNSPTDVDSKKKKKKKKNVNERACLKNSKIFSVVNQMLCLLQYKVTKGF